MATLTTGGSLAPRARSASQWFLVAAVFLGVLAAANPAAAQGRKARVSSDLAVVLSQADAGAAVPETIDVIVSGNDAFVARIAGKHGASIKKGLTGGAVLSVSAASLARMAADVEVGAISGDGDLRSQLATATESTGAAAAWAGEIAKLGAVMGTGIGVAIVDSGIDNHTALSGRIVASVDFTKATGNKQGQGRLRARHARGRHRRRGCARRDTGEEPVGMAPGAHLVSLKVLDENGLGKVSDAVRAIDWAIQHKAQYQIRIVNLSIGAAPTQSYKFDPLCQAVERAVKAGMVVVASSGNFGQNTRWPVGARDGYLAGDFPVRDYGGRAADARHGRPVGRCRRAVELEGADGGGPPAEAGCGGAGEQSGVAAGARVDAGEAVPGAAGTGEWEERLFPVERDESGDGGGEWGGGVVVGVAAAVESADGEVASGGKR